MTPPLWIGEEGPEGDVAVSTRARLARNLPDLPFPHRASAEQRRLAAQRIREAAKAEALVHLTPYRLAHCTEEERRAWVAEQRLSPQMLHPEGLEQRWALMDGRGTLSLLINEEDHLRIQAFGAGCAPEAVYACAEHVDTALQERLSFAYTNRLGYLTTSLANVGTGLRLSVLLHLPVLRERAALGQHVAAVCALGGTVRGLRGEGSSAAGALYQVSHEITYRPEQGPLFFVRCVAASASVLIQAERSAREALPETLVARWEAARLPLEQAQSWSAEEALELLSLLRLAALAGRKKPLPAPAFAEAVVRLHAEESGRAGIGRAALLRGLVRAYL